MQNKILITGATGTIGREVVKQLSKHQDIKIRACVRNPQKAKTIQYANVEFAAIDYNDIDALPELFKGIEKLFLLIPPSEITEEIRIGKLLIDEANRQEVKYITHLSAMGAEKDENSSHKAIEDYVNLSGITHCHLCPNFFMQNFSHYFLGDIKEKGVIRLYTGNAKISFVDVRDIAAMAVKTLINENPFKRYILTGPEALSHDDVAKILSEVSGKTIKYTAKSHDDTRETLRKDGWPEDQIEHFIKIFDRVVKGDFMTVHEDIPQLLDRPAINFKQYAEDYKEFW